MEEASRKVLEMADDPAEAEDQEDDGDGSDACGGEGVVSC